MLEVDALAFASDILEIVAKSRSTVISLSKIPTALTAFAGQGVRITFPLNVDDPVDESERYTVSFSQTADDGRRAEVDVAQVLREALAPHGFIPSAAKDDFIPLTGSGVPKGSQCFFATNNHVPLYAAKALAGQNICVVLHANASEDAIDNDALHSMGVHAVRLRTISQFQNDEIATVVEHLKPIQDALATAGFVAIDPQYTAKYSTYVHGVDPARIIEYSSTSERYQEFEAATGKILSPLVDFALPLGTRFRGRPFPDGVIMRRSKAIRGDTHLAAPEVATYDCKSTSDKVYKLSAAGGDQQTRYLTIQDRLTDDDGITSRGIIIFTSDVSDDALEDQAAKDAWGQIAGKTRRLIFVSSSALERWHKLTQREIVGFGSCFNRSSFWDALFENRLVGITERDHHRLGLEVGKSIKVVRAAEAELFWLSGVAGGTRALHSLAATFDRSDSDSLSIIVDTKPLFFTDYYRTLCKPNVSINDICTDTGFGVAAVKYLLTSDCLVPGQRETDYVGMANLDRLRVEIGAVRLSRTY